MHPVIFRVLIALTTIPTLLAFVLPDTAQYLIPSQSGSYSTEACSPSVISSTVTARCPELTSSFVASTPRLPLQTLPITTTAPNGCASNSTNSRKLPTQGLVIPNVPIQLPNGSRSPKDESWRIIVDHWQQGDASRGLTTPLKDWPREWLQGPNKIFAQKHFDRRVIALEYLEM